MGIDLSFVIFARVSWFKQEGEIFANTWEKVNYFIRKGRKTIVLVNNGLFNRVKDFRISQNVG